MSFTKSKNLGVILATLAYLLWGGLALYWHLLAQVNSGVVFSWRMVSTLITMLLYFFITQNFQKLTKEIKTLTKKKSHFLRAFIASVLISINWLVYIYAISIGEATQASIGYYIMPLLSIALAVIFLHEKIDRFALFAIVLALIAVILMTVESGQFPLIALILAFSFGFYGLIKKNIILSSDVSITFETLMITPFAIIWLIFFAPHQVMTLSEIIYLIFSGVITAIPLLLFAESLKHANLATVGFLQYINPTLQMLIAIFILGESLNTSSLQSIVLILISISIFSIGQFLSMKKYEKSKNG
ncbi:EamA family transporter RarD [Lactococcus nasutitermitis]|uniref:EamA family transporter RarD n=1 Tax=Lactococcus nasutitermitis TaxID=1652957 RepID=A0ABV9JCZ2_9LACT|nr:EamA family transporter RarD [Lactococcus nasutitermitis]